MPKTITLRLKDDVYNAFLEAALAENRPVSNLIETAAITKFVNNSLRTMSKWLRYWLTVNW